MRSELDRSNGRSSTNLSTEQAVMVRGGVWFAGGNTPGLSASRSLRRSKDGQSGNVGERCEKWSIFAKRILEDFSICCARRAWVFMLPHASGRYHNRRTSIR